MVEESITKSRPNLETSVLQIEHIMPQTLNAWWRNNLGADVDSWHPEVVHTIGNLTLIRHNQELSNKPFDEKKDIYTNNAGLQIAKTKITDQNNWDRNAIQNRATWIINYLLDNVLTIPANMR